MKVFFRKFLFVLLGGLIAGAPLNTVCTDENQNKSWFSARYLVPAYFIATAVFTAGFFLWKYRHKLLPSHVPKKPTIALNKSIAVGLSECKGASRIWSKNAIIKQIKVQSQSDYNGGGYASCAYHAFKNPVLIVNELTEPSKKLHEHVNNAELINQLFGKGNEVGTWRNMVFNRQKNPKSSDTQFDGEWVRGDALDYVIKHELDHREFLHPEARAAFDTIDDIAVIGLQNVDYVTPQVKANLAKAKSEQKSYLHCFLMSTAQHAYSWNGSYNGGTPGHWFAVVLHQKPDGKHEYIITDSLNIVRLHDERVEKLIATIEKAS